MNNRDQRLLFHTSHLILAQLSLGFSGILFWWLAARAYSVEDIGIGSAIISISSLLIFFASLGSSLTLVRFIPESEDKSKLLASLLGFSLILSFLFCGIFLIGIDFFLPKLTVLRLGFYPFLFIFFVLSTAVFQLLDGVCISFKETSLVLLKTIIQGFLRLPLLLFFIFLGGFGLFSSNCLAAIIALVFSSLYFLKKHSDFKIRFAIDPLVLKKMFPFSVVNFVNALPLNLPAMVFPLVILSLFSEKEAGMFYIPWVIFTTFCGFIVSVNNVFLMETSHGAGLNKTLKKTAFLSYSLGVIGLIFFMFWSDKVLLFFKKDFTQSSFFSLRVLFCSAPFFITNQIYVTVLNIKNKIWDIAIISCLIIISLFISVIPLLSKMGSQGVALGWLIANFIGTIYVLICYLLKRQKSSLLIRGG